jgi:hypothetical protein
VLEGKKLPEKLRRPAVSFAEIAKDALDYSRATKVPDAYRIDFWHMETLLGWFRDRQAEQITPQEIERKLEGLATDGRTPATVNRYRALLSLVYSLATKNGKIAVNPVRYVKRVRRTTSACDSSKPTKRRRCEGRFESSTRHTNPSLTWPSILACDGGSSIGFAGRMWI